MRALFLFLDGVGIGPDEPDVNPFLRARLPVLQGLLGGLPVLDEEGGSAIRPTRSSKPSGGGEPAGGPRAGAEGRDRESAPGLTGHLSGLDATLDVPGTPQSGDGSGGAPHG